MYNDPFNGDDNDNDGHDDRDKEVVEGAEEPGTDAGTGTDTGTGAGAGTDTDSDWGQWFAKPSISAPKVSQEPALPHQDESSEPQDSDPRDVMRKLFARYTVSKCRHLTKDPVFMTLIHQEGQFSVDIFKVLTASVNLLTNNDGSWNRYGSFQDAVLNA